MGLRFCARASPSRGKWGPLFIAVHGPLTIVASLVAEHRLQMRRLSSCGSWAQLLHGMWDLPRPGLEPVSPALAGRFLNHCATREAQIIAFYVFREHVLGVINLLSSLGRMWVSGPHGFIVLGHVSGFCCMVLLLSKPAWFCG